MDFIVPFYLPNPLHCIMCIPFRVFFWNSFPWEYYLLLLFGISCLQLTGGKKSRLFQRYFKSKKVISWYRYIKSSEIQNRLLQFYWVVVSKLFWSTFCQFFFSWHQHKQTKSCRMWINMFLFVFVLLFRCKVFDICL